MLKKLYPFLSANKKAVLLAPLLICIDVACEIVQPLLMSKIVDVGVQDADLNYILQMGLLMIGLSIISITVNLGNIYYSSQLGVSFSYELRKKLFNKIQELSFANLDKFSSASLITRITNDVNILQQVIIMSFRLLIKAPLMLVFAVIMAVNINAEMALIIVFVVPVLSLSIYFIIKKGIGFFRKMQQKLDWLNTVVQENITNIRLVKSFVREDFEIKKFGNANTELKNTATSASRIVIMMIPVMQLIMGISIVGIVWFGGNKIIAGAFQVGAFMSFITYITQILMSLMMLSMTIMTFSRASASYTRVSEVLDTETDIKDTTDAERNNFTIKNGKVEFNDVYFKYQPQAEAYILKNISFMAQAGETIGIIGPTGSSKSTLVQLIPRLYDTNNGNIRIDNRDIKDYTLTNLSNGISMVLQQNELFSGTIKENILWGNHHATEEEVVKAAQAAQAHDFIMSFPQQYDTVIEQGGVNVSGGQKQRICIARALLKKAKILILDNSTSALDTITEAKIRTGLQQNMQGVTLFIISQRISSIQQADKILVMDNGEIADSGTHATLMETCDVYREIYYSQQSKINVDL